MKKSKIPRVIILIGPPGSGKGTQASLLAERLNFYYFETSKVLEEEFQIGKEKYYSIEGKKYFLKKERNLWLSGKLCSPPFVTFLVKKKIKELFKEGKNLVLSGSPRTLYEGERVVPLLEKLYGKENIVVVLLEQPEKVTILRNTKRRICQLMRHPILSTKKEFLKLKYCPLDGSKLIKRGSLDKPETIKVRLKEYKERTFPLIEYFKKRKIKIKKVDAVPPPAIVFENILKAIR
jgi:adenylate kinase